MGSELTCPRCGAALEKSAYNGRIGFVCPERHGIAMTLGSVRALCGSRELVNLLWHKSGEPNSAGNAPCPVCGKPMSKVTLDVEGTPLELDICRRCQEVWFDPNELETLPPKPPEPEPEELPQAAREALALERIKNVRVRIDDDKPCTNSIEAKARLFDFLTANWGTDFDWDDIDSPLKFIAAVLGLPVEADAPPLRRLPLVTWFLMLLCIAVCALTFPDLNTIRNWGFIPAEFARKGGATWVTSMFMHGDWVHLVGNMYFFWVFGDNIEDELGKLNYIGFILLSGFSATLLHLLLTPGSTIPCVGASGFISGVVAMYAVLYPGVTIMVGFRRFFCYRLVGIPAWLAFLIWGLLQLLMAYLTYASPDCGGVAYAAHLGGAIPGLVCGFIMRYLRARRAEEFDRPDI